MTTVYLLMHLLSADTLLLQLFMFRSMHRLAGGQMSTWGKCKAERCGAISTTTLKPSCGEQGGVIIVADDVSC